MMKQKRVCGSGQRTPGRDEMVQETKGGREAELTRIGNRVCLRTCLGDRRMLTRRAGRHLEAE